MALAPHNYPRHLAESRRNLRAWSLLAALVLLGVLAAPFFAGRVYTCDDLGAFHLPLRAFYAQQLARGQPFDWMPQLFCGFYLSGEGQLGAYHPFHLLIYRFLPLRAAMAWELLASYPFMLAGMYWFLRRRLGRRDAAMFGALTFTFSSFNLLHFIHPNAIAIVAHIPWLLGAIDVLMLAQDQRRVAAAQAAIALLLASQLLLGYPQYVWFSLLAAAAYAACLHSTSATVLGWGENWRRWSHLAVALLLGGLAGAVQLLPTLDAVQHSARRAPGAEFVNFASLHPANLIQLVAPYLLRHRVIGPSTHELGCYAGAAPLVLVVWLVARRADLGRLRRTAATAAICGVLALLLAFGEFGPIYRLQRLLPLVGGFRCPGRYLVLVQLAVCVLAAVGFVLLVRQQERGDRTPWGGMKSLAVVAAASVGACLLGLFGQGQPSFGSPVAVIAGPLLVVAAAGLVALALRGHRGALAGLILLTALDLGLYGLSYGALPFNDPLDRYTASVATPPGAERGRVLADLLRFDEIAPHTGNQITLLGWSRADGYAGLEPARRLDYTRLVSLRAASVRWVRANDKTRAIDGLAPRSDGWLEVPTPLPRIQLVTRALPSANPRRDISQIDLQSAAIVDCPVALRPGSPGVSRVAVDQPGHLRVAVQGPTPQLLVLAESYHDGWQAGVNGRPVPVLRVNGDFLGCVVPAGEHEVVFNFQPASLRYGRTVSCLGVVLIFGLWCRIPLRDFLHRRWTAAIHSRFHPQDQAWIAPPRNPEP